MSGEYTALVIHPLSDALRRAVEESAEDFAIKFVESLPAVYRDFETDSAYLILRSIDRPLKASGSVSLSDTQVERLSLYISGVFTLEVVFDAALVALKKLIFLGKLSGLGQREGQLLIARLLQGRSWDEVSGELGMGKVAAANETRRALAKVFELLSKELGFRDSQP